MSKVLHLPGIVMAVSHSVFNHATAYNHHDVYLHPSREGGGGLGDCVFDDKYAYLRSRKMSSKCNLELRILDSLTDPFTISARLDVIHCICEAVYQAAEEKKERPMMSPIMSPTRYSYSSNTNSTDSLCTPQPSPYKKQNTPQTIPVLIPTRSASCRFDNFSPKGMPSGLKGINPMKTKKSRFPTSSYPPLEIKEKSLLTVTTIMRQWDIQVSLGRIVASSWPTGSSLSGVVLTLAGCDLQLRLVREVPVDYMPRTPFFSAIPSQEHSPPSQEHSPPSNGQTAASPLTPCTFQTATSTPTSTSTTVNGTYVPPLSFPFSASSCPSSSSIPLEENKSSFTLIESIEQVRDAGDGEGRDRSSDKYSDRNSDRREGREEGAQKGRRILSARRRERGASVTFAKNTRGGEIDIETESGTGTGTGNAVVTVVRSSLDNDNDINRIASRISKRISRELCDNDNENENDNDNQIVQESSATSASSAPSTFSSSTLPTAIRLSGKDKNRLKGRKDVGKSGYDSDDDNDVKKRRKNYDENTDVEEEEEENHVADDDQSEEEKEEEEEEDFPMQVVHLFTEIYYSEIYARDWSLIENSKFSDSDNDSKFDEKFHNFQNMKDHRHKNNKHNRSGQSLNLNNYSNLNGNSIGNGNDDNYGTYYGSSSSGSDRSSSAPSSPMSGGPRSIDQHSILGRSVRHRDEERGVRGSDRKKQNERVKNGELRERRTEPLSVYDLQKLFTPLYKLAHASKVVVSLTDDGKVAGKLNTFTTVGLLPKNYNSNNDGEGVHMSIEMRVSSCNNDNNDDNNNSNDNNYNIYGQRLHTLIGHERRKKSFDTTEGTKIKSQQTRFSSSPKHRAYFPSNNNTTNPEDPFRGTGMGTDLNRFSNSPLSLLNPSLLQHKSHTKNPMNNPGPHGTKDGIDGTRSPASMNRMKSGVPQTSLPDNTRTRTLVHRDSSSSVGSIMSPYPTQSPHTHTHSIHRDRDSTASVTSVRSRTSNSNSTPEVNPYGDKIWGLRVVDMRLLMTIGIRDSVFGYVGRCFEFFQYDVVVRSLIKCYAMYSNFHLNRLCFDSL